jgi:hypothetical protein
LRSLVSNAALAAFVFCHSFVRDKLYAVLVSTEIEAREHTMITIYDGVRMRRLGPKEAARSIGRCVWAIFGAVGGLAYIWVFLPRRRKKQILNIYA